MKAAIVAEGGVTIREVEKPTPGPEQVLVRVRAAGLNRADLQVAAGRSHGGMGGAGGSNTADAGSFDMSNAMNGTAVSAAGITTMAQNSGAASLIQQGVTVQANLTVGH